MSNEDNGQDESPFKDFVTHDVDGVAPSTSEGSQQEGAEEASGDADDTDTGADSSNGADDTGDDIGADADNDAGEEDGSSDADDIDDIDDTGGAEEGDAEEGDEKPKPKPKKKLTVKQRMNQMTKAQRTAERAAVAARGEVENRDARIAELEAENRKLTGDDDPDKDDGTGSDDGPVKPNPDDFTYGELDSEYVEALTAYQVTLQLGKQREKDEETRQSEAAEEQAQELQTQYDERVVDGLEAYDDFEDVVIAAADEGKYPLSRDMAMLAVESPVGHHVLYKIAGDLDLAKKLAQLPPVQQAREFGRLEAQFATDDDGENPPKPKKIPAARKPPTKRSGGKGAVPFDPATSNFADFEKRVNADKRRKA